MRLIQRRALDACASWVPTTDTLSSTRMAHARNRGPQNAEIFPDAVIAHISEVRNLLIGQCGRRSKQPPGAGDSRLDGRQPERWRHRLTGGASDRARPHEAQSVREYCEERRYAAQRQPGGYA